MEDKNITVIINNNFEELNNKESQEIEGGYSVVNSVISKIYNEIIGAFNP